MIDVYNLMGIHPESIFDSFREELPVVKNWIYLRHCNRGPLPNRTHELLSRYLHDQLLSGGTNVRHWFDLAEKARESIATYIGGSSASLAFTKNASEALSILLENFDWKTNAEILTSLDEYPQYVRILKKTEGLGLRLRVLESRKQIPQSINDDTQLILVSHVSWRNGERISIPEITDAAHRCGAKVVVDAVQSIGCFKVEAEQMGIDFLLGNSRKWLLGLDGLGFLYIHPNLVSQFTRLCDRNIAAELDNGFLNTEFHYLVQDARKLEPGCSNTIAALGLQASLELLSSVSQDWIESRILTLMEYATSQARKLGLKVISPDTREAMSGILAVQLDSDQTLRNTLTHLRSNNILATGYGNVLMFAIHFFNTEAETDFALSATSDLLA